jgi:ferrous iron transport protein A
MPDKTQSTAADLKSAQKGMVVKVTGDDSLRRRLNSMGIVRGAIIMADYTAPLGDPRSYMVLGYQITLRKAEAQQIVIELNQ